MPTPPPPPPEASLRRIADRDVLAEELGAWECTRNAAGATIDWLFDVDRARTTLARAYPDLNQSESQ